MWNSFNEVDELEKGKDYVCVIDEESHCFNTMEDANNYIAYQLHNERYIDRFPFIGYQYQIYNIKCTEVIK